MVRPGLLLRQRTRRGRALQTTRLMVRLRKAPLAQEGRAGASPDETGGAFASDAGSTSNAGSSSDASTAGAEDASTPLPLTDAGLTAAFTSLTTGLPVYLVWSRRSGRIDAAKPVRRPTKRRVPRERSGR